MVAPPAASAPEVRERSDRVPVRLAGLGAAAILVGGLLPWRTARISGSEWLVELVADGPGLAVPYVVAALAAVATTVLMIISAAARRLIVLVAVVAAVAAVVTLLATPLPSGNAIGATPNGRTIEFDVPSYRSWGCYLALAGGLLTLGAALVAGRKRPAR